MDAIYDEIQHLKKENNAVILAHYYVSEEVQKCADYIGDSFYLSRLAAELPAETLVFAGVSFMGESAKLLSPDKKVLMPEPSADCPMAYMASEEKIQSLRREYPDLAVVCYVNSTGRLKSLSDVCVTSSNAVKIVRGLPNRHIFFIPDANLGRFVAEQVPEKQIILNEGFCPVHDEVSAEQIKEAMAAHPGAKVLVHPECRSEVTELSDFAGSTSEIIDYASKSSDREFIIVTENGVFAELKKKNPDKVFYAAAGGQNCPGMKSITLEKVRDCLKYQTGEVFADQETCRSARLPLDRMLEAGK